MALFVAALVALPSLGGAVSPVSAAPTPCADLAISNFSVNGGVNPIAGQPTTINFTVSNNGSCSTNTSFVVQWKQTLTSLTGPSATVLKINAGNSRNVSLPYTFPKAGNFLTLVQVDTGKAISETNEVNNLAIYSVTVDKAQADLVVTDVTITTTPPGNPLVVGQGLLANAAVTIQNNGNVAIPDNFQVAWQPTVATPALTQNVSGLGANASTTINFTYNYPDIGSFYSKATVDSTHLISETNEFNNSDTVPVQVLPALSDLTVTGIDFSPLSPVAGQNVHVTVHYANIGFVTTGQNSTVSWKPGTLISPLSAQIGPVAAAGTGTIGFDYTYALGGSYNTTATVDSNAAITELDEGNNNGYAPIDVASANVDLTINSITVSPSSPTQGVNTTVTINISNLGNDAAGPFVVSWNPDANGISVPGLSTLTQQVNSLGANSSMNVVFNNFSWPTAESFHTVAEVDAFNVIHETNETNNEAIKDVTVSPGDIDLRIRNVDVSFSPSPSPQYGKVTATITVKNIGSLPVSWFQVQWLLVSTNTSGPSKWIPGLNPGESITFTLTGYYFHAGVFSSTVTADPMHLIPETDETNNTGTKSITITSVP